MKSMKLFLTFAALATCLFTSCSSDEDGNVSGSDVNNGLLSNSATGLYAIVKAEGAEVKNITPSDYVLTLDNIIAVNPETGEFKMKNTEGIDTVAFPIPTQYVIRFYSKDSFLFEAKLNSVISSMIPTGLTFCHFITDRNGLSRYDLGKTHIVSENGETIEGYPTKEQQQGMQRMYQILQEAGKVSSNIDYDFQFGDTNIQTSGLVGRWDLVEVLNGPDGRCKEGFTTKYSSGTVIIEIKQSGEIVFNYKDGKTETCDLSFPADQKLYNYPVLNIGETPFNYIVEGNILKLHYLGPYTCDHIPATFVFKRKK